MKLFGLAFLTFFCAICVAQDHSIREFTVDDGLPSTHVYEVKQDKTGFYWIATDEGVVRYDGYRFEQQKGPFAKDVWWTYQDAQDNIWGLSQGNRLSYLKGDSFHFKDVSLPNVGKNTAFQRLIQDEFDTYWLFAGSGAYRLKGDDFSYYSSANFFHKGEVEIPHSYPEPIVAANRQLYFVTKFPLTVWKTNDTDGFEKIFSYPDSLYSIYSRSRNGQKFWDPQVTTLAYNDFDITLVPHSYDTIYIIRNGNIRAFLSGKAVNLGPLPDPDMLVMKKAGTSPKSYAENLIL